MGFWKSVRRGIAKLVGSRIREDILLDFDNDDEPDHRFYRTMGKGRGFRQAIRDLRPALQEEQNKQAFKFFIENPFIRRLARMVAEFIVGNGISVKSKNPRVQEELDAWWNDPVNDWERRHFQLAVEFPLYGEVFLERVSNVFTGRHRYNWLDPLFVAQVWPHPKYPTVPAAVDFWATGAQTGGGGTIQAMIANGVPEETILASREDDERKPVVYFFRTNNLSGSLRGHSNYYPLFEWADVLDNAAFTMGERMVIMLTYVWHLKADNMDAETKKRWRSMLEQANPGSALLTGKDVDFNAVAPDLKAADFTEGAKFLRTLIAGTAGIPEHFLGDGGDTNLATARAMSLPTLRSFLQQQREFVCMIRTLARANLASVASHGRLSPEEIDDFTIQVDPMNPADVAATAGALNQLVAGLTAAKLEGWVTDEEAAQAVRNVIGDVAEIEDRPPSGTTDAEMGPAVRAAADRLRKLFGEETPAGGNGNGRSLVSGS